MILLLVLIYLAFISLGLPDAILGSAWPIIRQEFNVSIDSAGIVSFIISSGTIISSLFSSKIVKYFKTFKVIVISILMTSFALLGFAFAKELYQLCLLAIPLGLGAGSIDACLNGFVSTHYKSIHMNWLHAFWGIGAMTGPLILSFFILSGKSYRLAYSTVFIIQIILIIIILFSFPLFKKAEKVDIIEGVPLNQLSNREVIKIKGLKFALISFLCYCGYEASIGLWTSSFLVSEKNLSEGVAAMATSLFYIGITVGRLISGILSTKMHFQKLIRTGCIIGILGLIFLFLFPTHYSILGVALIGLGAAPFYPQMIHQTPRRFTKEGASSAMGLQMAFAYIGSTCIPPLIGIISKQVSLLLFPIIVLFLQIIVFVFSEITYHTTKNNLLFKSNI